MRKGRLEIKGKSEEEKNHTRYQSRRKKEQEKIKPKKTVLPDDEKIKRREIYRVSLHR